MSETDVLLTEFKRDPETGLARIIERFEKPLIRHARALLLDTEESRDVVQETFMRFLTEKPDVQNLGGWLYRVSRNLALDRLRKEKRHMRLEGAIPAPFIDRPGAAASQAASPQVRLDLARAYSKLTDEQREVVFLKVQEGLSYREISEVTGRPAGTVGWMLHEAFKRMAAELNPAANENRVSTTSATVVAGATQ